MGSGQRRRLGGNRRTDEHTVLGVVIAGYTTASESTCEHCGATGNERAG